MIMVKHEDSTGNKCRIPDMIRFGNLEPGKQYYAYGVPLFEIPAPDPAYPIAQGSYFSGRHYYIAFIKDDDPSSGVRIGRFSPSGVLEALSGYLPLDHANNIAWHEKSGSLLVSHCQSNSGNRWNRYSFVDPYTFEVVSTGDLEKPFFAMGYSAEREEFASAEWGGETVDIWNGKMQCTASYTVEKPLSLSQGVWCDADYIWFVRSAAQGACAELRLYRWDGVLAFVIPIRDVIGEEESISVWDSAVFCVCNNQTCDGASVYRLELTEAEPTSRK